jgi:hypothetical protein
LSEEKNKKKIIEDSTTTTTSNNNNNNANVEKNEIENVVKHHVFIFKILYCFYLKKNCY